MKCRAAATDRAGVRSYAVRRRSCRPGGRIRRVVRERLRRAAARRRAMHAGLRDHVSTNRWIAATERDHDARPERTGRRLGHDGDLQDLYPSARSASVGSTRSALRVGTTHASSETAIMSTAYAMTSAKFLAGIMPPRET